jgi:hypothetical protein
LAKSDRLKKSCHRLVTVRGVPSRTIKRFVLVV